MKLIFLGTSSGLAVTNRNPSAVAAAHNDTLILFDAGGGTVMRLLENRIDPDLLDAVFISHTHPDHAEGLFSLLQNMHLRLRKKPLQLFLPAFEAAEMAAVLQWFNLKPDKWSFRLSINEMKNNLSVRIKTIDVKLLENNHLKSHGRQCFSFFLTDQNGNSCMMTSDTDSLDHIPSGLKMNLLVSECTHIQEDETYRLMHKNDIRKVVFTHIPEQKESAAKASGIKKEGITCFYARDGFTIEVFHE